MQEEKKKNDSRKKMKPSNLNSRREVVYKHVEQIILKTIFVWYWQKVLFRLQELKQKLDNKENEKDVGSKEKKCQYSDRAEKVRVYVNMSNR